jgi:4-hydroxy-2-oxoheptanedioate aldolase
MGPFDLSINLSGGKVGGANDPDVKAALPTIAAAAKKAGKIAGIYATGAEEANRFAGLGFNLVSAIGDAGLIAAGANAVLDRI